MSFIKYPKFLKDFEGIDFPQQIFEKFSNIKFHGCSTSGSINVAIRKTDMTDKFSKFVNLGNGLILRLDFVRLFIDRS